MIAFSVKKSKIFNTIKSRRNHYVKIYIIRVIGYRWFMFRNDFFLHKIKPYSYFYQNSPEDTHLSEYNFIL